MTVDNPSIFSWLQNTFFALSHNLCFNYITSKEKVNNMRNLSDDKKFITAKELANRLKSPRTLANQRLSWCWLHLTIKYLEKVFCTMMAEKKWRKVTLLAVATKNFIKDNMPSKHS